jgi:pyrimidine deaminase RibD-like protein
MSCVDKQTRSSLAGGSAGSCLRATIETSPNPKVGCVIMRDGVAIGCGWTQPVGQAHAEVQALRDAAANGMDVRGQPRMSRWSLAVTMGARRRNAGRCRAGAGCGGCW